MVDVLAEAQGAAEIVRAFNVLYYGKGHGCGWMDARFMGVPILKYPTDLFAMQELVVETKPEVIVETGSAYGGSALYFAFLCQNLGRGRVVSVDLVAEPTDAPPRPKHPLIDYVTGSSTDPAVVDHVWSLIAGRPAMVLLDSDHRRDNVLAEMRAYAGLVPVGGYMIVEDGCVNGNPVFPEYGPGPTEAMEAFFAENDEFRVDESREKFMLTQNPCGYLRRVAKAGGAP